ncbi:hypothetical protein BGW38_000730 [Lunasporangiospora selenospora]|uniref:Uncharacterized protein n=1 Tax=Lunasporangiospora selenospora TaxID=979761 RepID=A0A9P6KIB4_9FUNG|nr:hypothetical protein BGW38_000730 [Lunasporangiospora selenospora]
MKTSTILTLGSALAVTYAVPTAIYAKDPVMEAKMNRLALGGFSTPSILSSSLHTSAAPINYGNLNLGTGMMPTQVVHYGTEYQPSQGYISPKLISTTGKDISFNLAKAERVRNLINADVDVGQLDINNFIHSGPASFARNEILHRAQ